MQVNYPKKLPIPHWDPVRVEYPVRKLPESGETSETVGHRWREKPEVIREPRSPIDEIKNYFRDYNVTKQLTISQTTQDYGFKLPETKRFNKHTSCTENQYIYPQGRKIADRTPQCSAHGTSEMRSSFRMPTIPSRLVTDKDQYKHPTSLPKDPPPMDPTWRTELEPLDTTHEGFEKYLDPYLTTSRLHHRPYTADQLEKPSNSKDIVTYYTFKDMPWIRTPKPKTEWRLPISRPKSMYDREKFKQDFREIRTHNKMQWVPGYVDTIYATIYYESQCPDSRDFIVEQLLPATGVLHKYFRVKLVPFGKADSVNDGRVEFDCQHGATECLGNLVQDCALDAMEDRSDAEKVAYVSCEMETEAGTSGDMHCVELANIPVDEVKECVSSEKGINLQLTSEYLTKLVRPKFIPTIVFGQTFNQNIQDSAIEDFIGTLCSMFKNSSYCARHYNDMAMIQLYQ